MRPVAHLPFQLALVQEEAKVRQTRSSPSDLRLRKPLEQMTPDELCRTAKELREKLASSAEQLQAVYTALYSKVRRQKADDLTPSFLAVANAGRRFTGVVITGARRTAGVDKTLVSARQYMEDRIQREADAKLAKETREVKKQAALNAIALTHEEMFGFDTDYTTSIRSPQDPESEKVTPTPEDFDDLYGEEFT